MNLMLLLLITLLSLKICLSIFTQNNDLKIIVDFVQSHDKPTSVVARVCWKSSETIKLATMLANTETPKNIAFLAKNETITYAKSNNHVLFVIDLNCEEINYFLMQAEADSLFRKPYRWLIFDRSEFGNDVPYELENINILIDSDVIITQEIENKDFALRTIYKINSKSDWISRLYGIWSPNDGLKLGKDNNNLSNVMKRKDLRGEPVTTSVVISNNSTKTELLDLSHLMVDTISKSTYRIVNPVHYFLNSSGKLTFTDTWGYYINNTWNGMIGDINLMKADLCGTVIFMTKERLPVLEYLIQPTPVSSKFVFRQPPLSYQNNLFLLPFTTNVWYCAAVFVLILTFILYINTKWDIKKYEEYNKQKMDQSCLPPAWSDITIFVLSAISQQGSSNELKGTLGRFVMFIVFLAFLFIYTSYSANIVALLQSTSNQIRTLNDLLNSKLELGVEDVAYNKYYFSAAYVARDPTIKAIFETKIAPKGTTPNFMSIEDGIKKMQKKPFAFNMNTGTGYKIIASYFQEHEKCGLQEIDFIQASNPWLCCRKHSPYAELFKVGFMRIQEHGLSDRENNLIYAKKPVCTSMGGSFGSVNMVDFYPVLLMLLYGMILALALLAAEIVVHRRKRRN